MKKSALFAVLATAALSLGARAEPDKDMKTVLDALADQNPKPIESLTAAEARKQPTPADATKAVIKKEKGDYRPMPVAKIEDRMIRGADGMIPVRIYTPEGKAPFPVIVYYHGGGFVIATNETYDSTARALANGSKAVVVAVEYRKAPEHKFPAAHEDAFAGYKWVLMNAKSFNGDPERIAVAGESAGGNLALNVALRARDERLQLPVHELLIYPVASSSMNTASYKKNAHAKPLNRAMMEWFVKNYTRSPSDLKDRRLNLLKANFQGLAPATIITAEIDPLMSEGKSLADRMTSQGVRVDYRNFEGVTHEFFGMAPAVSEAATAQDLANTNLRNSFDKQAEEVPNPL